MIDLHTHTHYSDGTDTVEEILKNAESKGLKYYSITDHNTCGAYKEIRNIDLKQFFSGRLITGIELNTKILNIPIEILGYNFDVDLMGKLVAEKYVPQKERDLYELRTLGEKCRKAGIQLPDDFVEQYDYSCFASKFIHKFIVQDDKNRAIIDEDAWNDVATFYRKYMSNPSSMLFVDMDELLPDFETACSVVKQAGGLVFVPHVYQYRENSDKILEAILKLDVIDGIECYYTTYTKEQNEYLMNLCKEKGLFMSGGSDYHGKAKPKVQLAYGYGDMRIPDEIVMPWYENKK